MARAAVTEAEATARLAECCLVFWAMRALRSPRAVFPGSWSASGKRQRKRVNRTKDRRTVAGLDFMQPLVLLVLVLAKPAPARDPLLALLVPHVLLLLPVAYALFLGEALPLGGGLWRGQRLLPGEEGGGRGEGGDGAGGGGGGGEGEEGGDEGVGGGEGELEQVALAVGVRCGVEGGGVKGGEQGGVGVDGCGAGEDGGGAAAVSGGRHGGSWHDLLAGGVLVEHVGDVHGGGCERIKVSASYLRIICEYLQVI